MKKRLIRVCAVMSLMAGMYLYAQKAETVGGWQEDFTQGSEEYSGMQATLKTESESMDPESINPEISMGILTDTNIVDIGNHVVAYRIPVEKIHAIWSLSGIFQGDYIVLFDLDRERRMYIPDTYGTILDIGVEPRGVNLRYVRGEDGEERQTCIPITFNPQEGDMLKHADYYFGDRVVAPTQELNAAAFPVKVWSETFEWKGETFETVFERTSPVYDLQLEEGGLFADYCLTVRDGKENVIFRKEVANYPIDFEEVYWFTDFSGDGIPDIAVCTGIFLGKESWSSMDFWIWDAESNSYQGKLLPKEREPSMPLWDKEQPILVSFGERDEARTEIVNMYTYVEDQWALVRSWIPLYEENLWFDEAKNIRRPDSYRVVDYADGEVVREEIIPAEIVWEDDIWDPDNERYCRLYPRTPEWEEVTVMLGEMPVDKYVRTEAEK